MEIYCLEDELFWQNQLACFLEWLLLKAYKSFFNKRNCMHSRGLNNYYVILLSYFYYLQT